MTLTSGWRCRRAISVSRLLVRSRKSNLEVVFGNDDVRNPLLKAGLGLALRADNFGLEDEPPVKRSQIRVATKLYDGQ